MQVASLVRRLDDRINPIVVLELRAAFNNRTIQTGLCLLGFVQLGTMAVLTGESRDDPTGRGGATAASILLMVAFGAASIIVPLLAAFRLDQERTSGDYELILASPIRARRVFGGKFFTAMLVSSLAYCVTAPFLSMATLLRGVDMRMILLITAMHLLIVAGVIVAALCLASYSRTLVGRVVCGLVLLGFQAGVVLASAGWTSHLLGPRGGFGWGTFSGVLIMAAAAWLFLLMPMYSVAIERLDLAVARQRERELFGEYRRLQAEYAERQRKIAIVEGGGKARRRKRSLPA